MARRFFVCLMLSTALVGVVGSRLAGAATGSYTVNLTGAQEVPGPGDPDATGSGTITVDDVTGLRQHQAQPRRADALAHPRRRSRDARADRDRLHRLRR